MPNSFAHIELSTDDTARAKKFYKTLFDWKFTDVPNMPYSMIDAGAQPGGGLGKTQSPEQPSAWLPYVEVASVKQTIAKAAKAGAKIVVEYMPIGEMGAIGVFQDPSGAHLGLWERGVAAPPATPPGKAAAPKKAPAKKPAAKKPAAKKPAAKNPAVPAPAVPKKAPAKKPAAKKAPAPEAAPPAAKPPKKR